MTANQINYAKHREDVRTHLVNESLGKEANEIARGNLAVAERNAATNAQNAATNAAAVAETRRNNDLLYNVNMATIQQREQASLREYDIKRTSNTIAQQNADTNVYGAQTNRFKSGSDLIVSGAKLIASLVS